MDMSVKLNLSYPAARSAEQVAEKPVTRSTERVKLEEDKKDLNAAQDADKVKSAVSEIEKFMKASQRNLEFSTDEESGKIVVKVIATDSGELIRQLPSEEALRIARSLSDVNSVLFNAKV
ncbi:flagellar protein FlaG [Pseudomonas sp. Leaf58]|uniref:flagellar protein FlaG n=1 Tax=Pseudomonas TaxID=286 RepID=UPI0006F36299|nr:flagellar protein FlaG [Pseudomonas sp. Leaf58]AYG46020.1 flagellar protein FlaG [Pseudomonas sp. Leaf58]KQN59695.1 flagellar biosynthesis protein FlaG [Pseudomonas sp. Leaf58]